MLRRHFNRGVSHKKDAPSSASPKVSVQRSIRVFRALLKAGHGMSVDRLDIWMTELICGQGTALRCEQSIQLDLVPVLVLHSHMLPIYLTVADQRLCSGRVYQDRECLAHQCGQEGATYLPDRPAPTTRPAAAAPPDRPANEVVLRSKPQRLQGFNSRGDSSNTSRKVTGKLGLSLPQSHAGPKRHGGIGAGQVNIKFPHLSAKSRASTTLTFRPHPTQIPENVAFIVYLTERRELAYGYVWTYRYHSWLRCVSWQVWHLVRKVAEDEAHRLTSRPADSTESFRLPNEVIKHTIECFYIDSQGYLPSTFVLWASTGQVNQYVGRMLDTKDECFG